MLSRKYRLRRRKDFSRLYRQGRTAHSGSFSIKYKSNNVGHNRVGIVASTKVSKKAPVRNRLRRQLYSQARHLLDEIDGDYDIIILVKTVAIGQNGNDLGDELRRTLKKAGLIQ